MKEIYLNSAAPKTIRVASKTHKSIIIINEHDFDAKTQTRVNEHGQEINEHGRVIDVVPIAGPEVAAPAVGDSKIDDTTSNAPARTGRGR